jgi:hypothetical protein
MSGLLSWNNIGSLLNNIFFITTMELDLLQHFLSFDYRAGNKVDKYLRSNLELKGKPFIRSRGFSNGFCTTKKINLYTIKDNDSFDLDIYHTRKTLIKNNSSRSFEKENILSFVGSLGLVQEEVVEKIEDLLQGDYEVRSEVSPLIAVKRDIGFKLRNFNLRYL